jgi:hypothetical protein
MSLKVAFYQGEAHGRLVAGTGDYGKGSPAALEGSGLWM